MKIKEVVEILETNPKNWTFSFQSDDATVFAWGNYRLTKLSDRLRGSTKSLKYNL